MLNKDESRVLTACRVDMILLRTRVEIQPEQMLADIQATHKTVAAILNIGGKRLNQEERRVMREANQQLYLSCEDIEKHKDITAAGERLGAFCMLLETVVAGEVKAK